MYLYTTLRLLLAGFFLYFSWPFIPLATSSIEKIFWGTWLLFLYVVLGGNLATFLRLNDPPVYEQADGEEKSGHKF